MDKQYAIEITGVTKIFRTGILKKKLALDSLSLSIPSGKVVGLLGPNGSGKSTTMKLLLGFIKPTAGKLLVGGHSAGSEQARRLIGYLPENPKFQKFLRAKEALAYFGSLLGFRGKELYQKCDDLLELVNLKHAANERVQGFSKGMTQRLAIAQALFGDPSLLIFDEPMSGLDPIGRREIRRLISRIHEQMPQTTILFSSHVLSDVEDLCSSVALVRKGKLISFCPIEQLLIPVQPTFRLVVQGSSIDWLKSEFKSISTKRHPFGWDFEIEGTQTLNQVLDLADKKQARVVTVESQREAIELELFSDSNSSSSSLEAR